MWDRFRENAYQYRGYRGFNKLDRISLVAVGLGTLVFLVSFLLNSDRLGGLGLILLIVGFLTLTRAFPGHGG